MILKRKNIWSFEDVIIQMKIQINLKWFRFHYQNVSIIRTIFHLSNTFAIQLLTMIE